MPLIHTAFGVLNEETTIISRFFKSILPRLLQKRYKPFCDWDGKIQEIEARKDNKNLF
jgi:hypothetical protein